MSRAILVGLNAQNDCLVASRFCCTVGGWGGVWGGYNSVQRYGTTTGNAYWALAMQKYRFVSMSLRGSECVHQPNTIVGKCNASLVLNSTSILTTCAPELCCLSFMTQDPKMWPVNFKIPVWWPKIRLFKSKITDVNTIRIKELPSSHKFLYVSEGIEPPFLNFAIVHEGWLDHF